MSSSGGSSGAYSAASRTAVSRSSNVTALPHRIASLAVFLFCESLSAQIHQLTPNSEPSLPKTIFTAPKTSTSLSNARQQCGDDQIATGTTGVVGFYPEPRVLMKPAM